MKQLLCLMASFVVLLAALDGKAAPRCSEVFPPSAVTPEERALDLERKINEAVAKNPTFPDYQLLQVLNEYYGPLNKEIDRLVLKTHSQLVDQMNGDIQVLGGINQQIVDGVKRLQDMMNPGRLAKFFGAEKKAELESAKVIHEIAFCKSRSEACIARLRPQIEKVEAYHLELIKFGETLKSETQGIEQLLSTRHGEVTSPILVPLSNFLGSFATTAKMLEVHLQMHKKMISKAVGDISLSETQLQVAARALLVNDSIKGKTQGELTKLQQGILPKHQTEIESFTEGASVFFLSEALGEKYHHFDHDNVTGKVVRILEDGKIEVAFTTYSGLLSRARESREILPVEDLVLSGCHFGVCTGDLVPKGIMLKMMLAGWSRSAEPMWNPGTGKVYGFNPVTQKFLYRQTASGDGKSSGMYNVSDFWIPKDEMIRVHENRGTKNNLPPEMTEGSELTEGEWVAVFDSGKKKTPKNSVENAYIGKAEELNGQMLIVGPEGKVIAADSPNVALIKCFGGLCPGDIVQADYGPQDQIDLVVIGYSATKDQYLLGYKGSKYHSDSNQDILKAMQPLSAHWSQWHDAKPLQKGIKSGKNRVLPPIFEREDPVNAETP